VCWIYAQKVTLKSDCITYTLFRVRYEVRVGSVLAMGPTGLSVAGSGPAEDGEFLWIARISSAHFLRRGSKAVGPVS
jgi:hypothetical protein